MSLFSMYPEDKQCLTDIGILFEDQYAKFHPSDSDLWLEMFILAEKIDHNLCSILQYVRNVGAILEPNKTYGHIIRPVIGVNGWESQAEYDRERQVMSRFRAEITDLLRIISRS